MWRRVEKGMQEVWHKEDMVGGWVREVGERKGCARGAAWVKEDLRGCSKVHERHHVGWECVSS